MVRRPRQGVGARLSAFTGVGRVGFLDTMEITEWEPPRLVRVLHTGRVVRGPGIFEVLALPDGRSRFVWREELDLPLGAVGRAGFSWWVRCSRPGSRGHCVVSPSWWAPGSWAGARNPPNDRGARIVADPTFMGNNVPSGPVSGPAI